MSEESLPRLIAQLTSDDPELSRGARQLLMGMDEDAVNPLVDAFYSGVSESGGLAILELVGQIGGPDALSLLRNVFHTDARYESWRRAAAVALLYNIDSLDGDEADEVVAYVDL